MVSTADFGKRWDDSIVVIFDSETAVYKLAWMSCITPSYASKPECELEVEVETQTVPASWIRAEMRGTLDRLYTESSCGLVSRRQPLHELATSAGCDQTWRCIRSSWTSGEFGCVTPGSSHTRYITPLPVEMGCPTTRNKWCMTANRP